MQQHARNRAHLFSASEVAEFEYCSLSWWHDQFEPWAHADSEELFARMVELEHEHGPQAPALPEYRMLEQLLLRRGAFEQGQQQHQEHADAVSASEDEEDEDVYTGHGGFTRARLLNVAIICIVLVALLLIGSTFFFH